MLTPATVIGRRLFCEKCKKEITSLNNAYDAFPISQEPMAVVCSDCYEIVKALRIEIVKKTITEPSPLRRPKA